MTSPSDAQCFSPSSTDTQHVPEVTTWKRITRSVPGRRIPAVVARSAGRTLSGAHAADLNTQERYGVSYLRYWVDEAEGKSFCLVEAPDAQAAASVH